MLLCAKWFATKWFKNEVMAIFRSKNAKIISDCLTSVKLVMISACISVRADNTFVQNNIYYSSLVISNSVLWHGRGNNPSRNFDCAQAESLLGEIPTAARLPGGARPSATGGRRVGFVRRERRGAGWVGGYFPGLNTARCGSSVNSRVTQRR